MKKYFIAGLLIWIPLGITFWVLKLLVDTMDQTLLLLPARLRTDALIGVHIPGMGVLLTIAIVLVTGIIAANFFGKKIVEFWEGVFSRIPIVRSIYGGVKQISDTLFSPEGQAFRKAVLVHYPHSGAWTVALLTGSPEGEVTDHLGRDQYSVFVPTTPNITAGFFLIVPKSEVIELQMSVDEALKYIISMGVAEPPRRGSGTTGSERQTSGPDPNTTPL
jgi:uncharacterized membrane protein